jgi:RNA polymerase sigma factor (TIGR02999 family)
VLKTNNEITEILAAWKEGEKAAIEDLLQLVARELRQLAHAHMRKEAINHTLQTTALINEAYLKLIEQKNVQWQSRSHFFAIASKIMRRILLDHAKTRLRDKRGGGAVHVELENAYNISVEKSAEIVALDEALNRLAEIDPLKSQIVEMRHFGGMSVEETAEVLGIAQITVMRHWGLAKSWLRREIVGV